MSLRGQACGTAKHTAENISTSGFPGCVWTMKQVNTQTWWYDRWRCKRHWWTIVMWVVSPGRWGKSGIVKHVVGVVERGITCDGSISFSKLEIWVERCCCCYTSHWSAAIHWMLSSCPSINIVVALLQKKSISYMRLKKKRERVGRDSHCYLRIRFRKTQFTYRGVIVIHWIRREPKKV